MALTDDRTDSTGADRPARKGWLAAGGVVGAFLASACCIGPLVLLTLGISGAWIGNLTALEPYKPIFAVFALGFIVTFVNGGLTGLFLGNVVVDVPQLVDLASNPYAYDFLHRDCTNMATWFSRAGLEMASRRIFPLFICGMTSDGLAEYMSIWPPIRSVITAAPPL